MPFFMCKLKMYFLNMSLKKIEMHFLVYVTSFKC